MSRALCKEFGRGGRGYFVPERNYGMLSGLAVTLAATPKARDTRLPVHVVINSDDLPLLRAELALILRQPLSDESRALLAQDGAQ